MSASLQYSDYSDDAAFAIPYEVMARGEEETYLTSCKLNMANYAEAVRQGLDNDAAGYMAPQGLRNVLIISATPYQWKHINYMKIHQIETGKINPENIALKTAVKLAKALECKPEDILAK